MGPTEDAHFNNLGEVLRSNKCEFMMESVEYLGHTNSSQGIHPLEAKKLFSMPHNLKTCKQLHSCLGLLNYEKFMRNL